MRQNPGRDLLRGAGQAALIGGCGLGLYILAFKAGISLDIVAAALPDVWWRIPVLLLRPCRMESSRRCWSLATC
jgi:hypothetical protein